MECERHCTYTSRESCNVKVFTKKKHLLSGERGEKIGVCQPLCVCVVSDDEEKKEEKLYEIIKASV